MQIQGSGLKKLGIVLRGNETFKHFFYNFWLKVPYTEKEFYS